MHRGARWRSARHAPTGQPMTGPGDPGQLAAVLAAAAGPLGIERAREDAAVEAYRAARTGTRQRSALARTPLPWARAAAWLAAVAVAGTTGAALAAGVKAPDHPARSTAGAGPAPAASGTQPPAATAPEDASPSRAAPSAAGSNRPTPVTALKGLCTAYLASGDQPGKALSSTALGELVAAAGGADRVTAFCQGLVPSEQRMPPRPTQGDGARPSTVPSNRPSMPDAP
jgi:hypothetical protein